MFETLRSLLSGKKSSENFLRSIPLRSRDCHSHVVPGVDDGSRTISESLAMLKLLKDAGAQTVIATPHIFPGRYPNEPENLRREFVKLQIAAQQSNIPINLELGAEHYLDESLLPRIKQKRVISFGHERYVLFETHTGAEPPVGLMEVVHCLCDYGYCPLIAHVERYRWLRGPDGFEICADLRSAGAKFQVNRTVGKTNIPGKGPRGQFLATLLRYDWVDEVGSDLHRPTPEGRPYTQTELISATPT